jgi:methyl-accepting chemotaxis protein
VVEMIKNLEMRVEKIEDVLAGAATGEFNEIEVKEEDILASIEIGLNLLLTDLKDQIDETNMLVNKQKKTLDIFNDYADFAKNATENIKSGNLDIELPPKSDVSEINKMRDSFEFLIATIRLIISDIDENMNRNRNGNCENKEEKKGIEMENSRR